MVACALIDRAANPIYTTMSILGVQCACEAEAGEYSSRLKIVSADSTDPLGHVTCQQSLSIQIHAADGSPIGSPLTLSLRLTPDKLEPIFSGAAWAGTVLWRAATRLIDVLLDDNDLCSKARVIELGSGLGVPGMVAARLGARTVVLTEQESLVELLQRNVATNFGPECPDIMCRTLNWSAGRARQLRDELTDGAPFDLILCCDCVYKPLYGDSFKLLAQTIDALAGTDSSILVAVERRFVRDDTDGVDEFLALLKEAGFESARLLNSLPPIEIIHLRRVADLN